VSCHKSGVIEYLKKGQQVFVSGRLSINAVCKDGKAYQNNYVNAAFVNLCSSPRN
jgi:single-stranded DNA-binding protein